MFDGNLYVAGGMMFLDSHKFWQQCDVHGNNINDPFLWSLLLKIRSKFITETMG